LNIENMDNILTLTMHRAENVDDKQRVTSIIGALKELDDMNIIFPIHPRTKNTLESFGLFDELNDLNHVHIIKPIRVFGFPAFNFRINFNLNRLRRSSRGGNNS
jgi:UDP-N-acetylglucosamine 2-epimerase